MLPVLAVLLLEGCLDLWIGCPILIARCCLLSKFDFLVGRCLLLCPLESLSSEFLHEHLCLVLCLLLGRTLFLLVFVLVLFLVDGRIDLTGFLSKRIDVALSELLGLSCLDGGCDCLAE